MRLIFPWHWHIHGMGGIDRNICNHKITANPSYGAYDQTGPFNVQCAHCIIK